MSTFCIETAKASFFDIANQRVPNAHSLWFNVLPEVQGMADFWWTPFPSVFDGYFISWASPPDPRVPPLDVGEWGFIITAPGMPGGFLSGGDSHLWTRVPEPGSLALLATALALLGITRHRRRA